MPNLKTLTIQSIIHDRNLSIVFQPIIENGQQAIFGYEALTRGPVGTDFHSPIALFEAAKQQGCLVALELLCRELSISAFKQSKLPGKLFLNASPETLFEPNFKSGETLKLLQNSGLSPSQVVIELTEHSPLENYELVRDALKHYKEMGFEIAMDDLGSGYSGLRMWYELRPDFVKIDRHFICDIDTDKVKQQFVRSIKNIAEELNCKVIAEGIETADEFQFIEKIGAPFCQGYYFSRPEESPIVKLSSHFFQDRNLINATSNRILSSATIGDLLLPFQAIDISSNVQTCTDLFNQYPDLDCIPIVKDNQPVGVVRRSGLTNLLFSKYGHDLSNKFELSRLIDQDVLLLEEDLAIEQASLMISEKINNKKVLEFIIVKQGQYKGIGLIIDLLKEITSLQINNARYANPLTLLPGNVPISKKLDYILSTSTPFTVCYIDLDNFKPYNDYYGYEKGDQIILGLADILRAKVNGTDDFIGHIGGDDFILISSSIDWKQQCERILNKFSDWVGYRYRPEDLANGGISGEDRMGEKQFYPLLSISIGCVCLPPPYCKSHHDVAVLTTHAKSMAKKIKGNSIYIYNESKHQIEKLNA
ncbi:bifunctional diguanylate cyclase/phosphodiesterase [Psychromonas sp. 14N.309.X.WAT.B.A12]|uniref:bifunctional diguanylate cyclase/phosphodiesterase n=1 Tax=unclassified Psychromonas TaxID=2614957 RepID=UPI0025AEE27A|nr:bifunctional diguanylate cyclase/phosphodiesterase [Psychromonas sp. 14N.309.X.WAT.B.A12]MDN2662309.1 EAL and GGDEF domain-containing protein [Psychromonas sp. 14N.309.X.WAT.B.A12]